MLLIVINVALETLCNSNMDVRLRLSQLFGLV